MLAPLVLALASAAASAVAWPGQGKPVFSTWYPSYHADILPPSAIPWSQLTHLDYFVAESPVAVNTPLVPLRGTEANMKAVIQGAHAHGVSVSISIGGATGSRTFSYLVGSAANRTAFANNVVSFVRKQGLGCDAVSPQDTNNFLLFIKTLRQKLGSGYRLSADLPSDGLVGSDGRSLKDLTPFSDVLDYVNLMSYDIFGPAYFKPNFTTGPNAPLYDTCAPDFGKYSVSTEVDQLLATKIPPSKLVLGVPAYGYGYKTLNSTLARTSYGTTGQTSLLYQDATHKTPPGGPSDDQPGVNACGYQTGWGGSWLYRELVEAGYVTEGQTTAPAYGKGAKGGKGYTRYYDSCSQTPFIFNPTTLSFIAYDDPVSVWYKARLAARYKLAGVNVFDATGDTPDSILFKSLHLGFASFDH